MVIVNLTVPNFKLYRRYVCIEKKAYIEFRTICDFMYPLRVLEHIPCVCERTAI